jgi:hypothetical protein
MRLRAGRALGGVAVGDTVMASEPVCELLGG